MHAVQPEDLSLIPRAHIVERESLLPQLSSDPTPPTSCPPLKNAIKFNLKKEGSFDWLLCGGQIDGNKAGAQEVTRKAAREK